MREAPLFRKPGCNSGFAASTTSAHVDTCPNCCLFAGQSAAWVGFIVYSGLLDNGAFIVTNSCILTVIPRSTTGDDATPTPHMRWSLPSSDTDATMAEPLDQGRRKRTYPHGSGDRNAWSPTGKDRMPIHEGGTERDAPPAPDQTVPGKRPRKKRS